MSIYRIEWAEYVYYDLCKAYDMNNDNNNNDSINIYIKGSQLNDKRACIYLKYLHIYKYSRIAATTWRSGAIICSSFLLCFFFFFVACLVYMNKYVEWWLAKYTAQNKVYILKPGSKPKTASFNQNKNMHMLLLFWVRPTWLSNNALTMPYDRFGHSTRRAFSPRIVCILITVMVA